MEDIGSGGPHVVQAVLLAAVVLSFPLFHAAAQPPGSAKAVQAASTIRGHENQEKAVYPPMAPPGRKVPIGADLYMVYGFDRKPKLGTVIMKVEILDAKGVKDTSWEVRADAGMPSMRGVHETGERTFALSKKGDYLLPITIVMPGDWEVRMVIFKEGKPVFRGSYRFDV